MSCLLSSQFRTLSSRRILDLKKRWHMKQAFDICYRGASMFAWKINDSLNQGDYASRLHYEETRRPFICSPWDVLVKVHATSINPLDLKMTHGYGRRLLDLMSILTDFKPRITNDRYPLTLGRDFSGEVVSTGPYVKNLQPGDQVMGVVEPHKDGAHAQFVTTPAYCVAKKPSNLSHHQAASVPFVSLTAYSALSTFGCLPRGKCSGKQVLVIGGSGGVGSFAIQLLKLWGANVVATCSEEKIDWLENSLFVDQAISHHDPIQMETLRDRFDFVLDCGQWDEAVLSREQVVDNGLRYLKPRSGSVYVTLSPPVLSNVDSNGLFLGTAKTVLQVAQDTAKGLANLNSARWAVFLPNKSALDYIISLLAEQAVETQVSSTLNFSQLPQAFDELARGTARGKVVVDVSSEMDTPLKDTTTRDHHKASAE